MRFSIEITPSVHQLTQNPRLGFTLLGFTKPTRNQSEPSENLLNRTLPLRFPHSPRDSIGGTPIGELFRRVLWWRSLIKWFQSHPCLDRAEISFYIRISISSYVWFRRVIYCLRFALYWFCVVMVCFHWNWFKYVCFEYFESILLIFCSKLPTLSFKCMSIWFNFVFLLSFKIFNLVFCLRECLVALYVTEFHSSSTYVLFSSDSQTVMCWWLVSAFCWVLICS